jgi:hypothetical protein
VTASRDHGAADLNAAQRALDDLACERAAASSYDDLRAQLAAVTAERDALRTTVAAYFAAVAEQSAAFDEYQERGGGTEGRIRYVRSTSDVSKALDALRELVPEVPA